MGSYALNTNTTGYKNVAIGGTALFKNNTGSVNIAVGDGALSQNINGISNVAIGASSLGENRRGNWNVGVGSVSLQDNNIGSGNTGIGFYSLLTNFDGDFNTGLGYLSTGNTSSLINATAIGANSIVNTSNKVRIGDATVTIVEGPVAYTVSDGRFKKNINENDIKGLEFINRLRPVVYNFDTRKFQEFLIQHMPDSVQKKYLENKDFSLSTDIRQSGFIAQEVESAAKEAGYDFNGVHVPESKEDNYSLAYGQFVVPLVKSVQELSKQNEELKKELAELRSLIVDKKNNDGSITISESGAKLYQNAPNPFTQSTTIKYSLPAKAKNATIVITSSMGVVVKEYQLVNKAESVNISGGILPAGTYTYSLFVDEKLIDTQKMILTQ